MALKISNTGLFTNHYLILKPEGIRYCETAFLGGRRHFGFSEIECILLSSDFKLSFQVGKEVFSIPTDMNNAKHQQVIAAFVSEVKRAGADSTESV